MNVSLVVDLVALACVVAGQDVEVSVFHDSRQVESPQQQSDLPILKVGQPIESLIEEGDPEIHTEVLDENFTASPTVGTTYVIEVELSGAYFVELRSYLFDAYLVLSSADGVVLGEDDDGLLRTHSRLVVSYLEAGSTYFLDACALHGMRGPYELVLRKGRPPAVSARERADEELVDLERRTEVVEAVAGPESEAFARALKDFAVGLHGAGRYAAARPLYERSLAIMEAVLGPKDLNTASSASALASLLLDIEEFSAARPLFERAVETYEEVLGPNHAWTATSLYNLGALLKAQGELEQARSLLERACEIREEALGPDHHETGQALGVLGMVHLELGELDEAYRLGERALAISETVFGAGHPTTGRSLNALASVLMAQGEAGNARMLLERALVISEQVHGPEHPATATYLSNLGAVIQAEGDLPTARTLLERALEIRESVLGVDSISAGNTLSHLGLLLHARGYLADARPILERALKIFRDSLGLKHPVTAASMDNLGLLLHDQGDYKGARMLMEEALEIEEQILGPKHPDTIVTLNNLAAVSASQGETAEAELLFERALRLREEVLGPSHPYTIISLINLARLLHMQSDLPRAQQLYARALAVCEDSLGPEHLLTAVCIKGLARLAHEQGDPAAAKALLERALSIQGNLLGPYHPDLGIGLNDLARLLADLGEIEQARGRLSASADARRAHLQHMLVGLTEAESFQYLARFNEHLELLQSLCASTDPEILAQGYQGLVAWKGRIARALSASRTQLSHELSDDQRVLLDRLQSVQAQLSGLLIGELRDRREEVEDRVTTLARQRNELELELVRTLERSAAGPNLTLADLRAALPARAVSVDFYLHRIYRPASLEGGVANESGSWSGQHLIAWVMRPAGKGEPLVRVDLGPASRIEVAAKAFLQNLVAEQKPRRASESDTDRVEELRRLVWDPLGIDLEQVETVFISPDGFLGTLPFETLSLEDGSFLVEHAGIVYLQDASSLPREGSGGVLDTKGSLLAVGAVDFLEADDWSRGTVEPVSGSLPGGARFTKRWPELPQTGYEVDVIEAIHEAAISGEQSRLVLRHSEPTEERLKAEFGSYEVLHLATHGFFQPEGTPSMWESALDEHGRDELRMRDDAAYLVGEHPGLLSGLVCAGANQPDENRRDDGYLTAEEVGWLELEGVKMVVLSACETGLGRARSGEGLIGLRRAFRTAGVETVVSSLWAVSDESTAKLMLNFYENLWVEGMGRLEALREAQLEMLRRNRMENGSPQPSSWGAFVLNGEWR